MKKNDPVGQILLKGFMALCLGLVFPAAVQAMEKVDFIGEFRTELMDPVDAVMDQNGDTYVLDQRLSKVFVFDAEGKLKMTLGEEGSGDGMMIRPRSLALSDKGEIYVADTGNSRVLVFGPNGRFLHQLGNSGTLPGEFKTPDSIAIDTYGFVYVADVSNKTISVFSPNGVFLEARHLDFVPEHISFDNQQNLYILAKDIQKIVKYPLMDGKFKEISFEDQGRNVLEDTAAISVDNRGDIYLLDHRTHSIKKIDQDGHLLFSFGSRGEGRGQFDRPMGISADWGEKLVVADSRNNRVQVLKVTGSEKTALNPVALKPPVLDFEHSISLHQRMVDLTLSPDNALYGISDVTGQVYRRAINGAHFIAQERNETMPMNEPHALHVSRDGRILVADTGNNMVQFLKDDGSYEYHFGQKGWKASQFKSPQGIAMSPDGYIYVADTYNHRIQVFNKDGIFLKSFGERSRDMEEFGPEFGKFLSPTHLSFDSKGQLYVLDSGNQRIQVMDKDGNFIRALGGMNDRIQFEEPVDISLDENNYLYVADKRKHAIHIIDPDGNYVLEFGSSGKGPSYFPNLTSVVSHAGRIYVADKIVDKVQVFRFDPNGIQDSARAEAQEADKSLAAKKVVKSENQFSSMKSGKISPQVTVNEPIAMMNQPAQPEMSGRPAGLEDDGPSEIRLGKSIPEQIQEMPYMDPLSQEIKFELSQDKEILLMTKVSEPANLNASTSQETLVRVRDIVLGHMIQELANKFKVPTEPIRDIIKIESQEVLQSGQLKVTISVPRKIKLEQEQVPQLSKQN